MKKSSYYQKVEGDVVECLLCPHHCRIADGKSGICKSRRNYSGALYSLVYGCPVAVAIDPIEKKPLYHFHPGTKCLSLACTGCNLRCLHCQNHDISQISPEQEECYRISPQQLVDMCVSQGIPGIAYTYTEPLTYIEYVSDCAKLAHEHRLWNILVTAGYVEEDPLNDLIPYIDAANIDLKYFSDERYQKVSGAHLDVVLRTILTMHKAGVWIELTNLIIPGVNDDMEMIRQMCQWIVTNGMAEVPLHLSRFFPHYKMIQTPPTPISTLQQAKDIAISEGIFHVHLGNV